MELFSITDSQITRPPGPAGLPVVGSLPKARRDPLAFALQLTRRYGDISYYNIGRYTGYLLNRPEYIRHVLQSNHRNYSKENHNYKKLKPVIGEGLITSNGEQWRRERRMVQPVFHRAQISKFAAVTTAATAELIERWEPLARENKSVDVAADMMGLSLRIIAEALFGDDLRGEAKKIARNFGILNADISQRFQTIFRPPRWIPTPRNQQFKRARRELDRVVSKIIDRRRQTDNHRGNLLDILLSARDNEQDGHVTNQQIRDEVMTFLLAGHETTAALLSWTWYLLSMHPAVARKLRTELDEVLGGRLPTPDDTSALQYTEMVLLESMRLYPPVWIISRTALNEDVIGGYTIPAGSTVTLVPYTMHRHPGFWTNPEGFDPQRFSSDQTAKRPRLAYFPFGGGPRLCIGRHVAMMEAQLIIATLAQKYDLSLIPGHSVVPEPLVTLRPRGGLRMRLHPLHPH